MVCWREEGGLEFSECSTIIIICVVTISLAVSSTFYERIFGGHNDTNSVHCR